MQISPSAWAATSARKSVHCPFSARHLAERQQTAEAAVSGATTGIDEQARRVLQIEPGPDDEFDPAHFACGKVGAHHAGKRVAVGDGDGRKSKRLAVATNSSACEPPRRKEKLVVTSSSA